MKEKEYYTAPELAKMFDLNIQTVYSRFKSPYSRQRWGVEIIERSDRSLQKVVRLENVGKWKVTGGIYVGRPIVL